MNLTTSYDDVIRFASAQDLQNFYRRYGLDGLEVMPLPYSSAEAPGDYLSPELCPLLQRGLDGQRPAEADRGLSQGS